MPLVRSETANNARRENRVEPNAEENRKKRGEIRMDALEFLQCYYAMCYHRHSQNGCGDCEAQEINCELTTDYPEKLVEAVEQWAKAHPEEAADATKPKNDEPCVKMIQDNLEGAIYRSIASNKTRIENLENDVAVIRINLSVLDDRIYALRESERTRMCCWRRFRMPMYTLEGFQWRARCHLISTMIAASSKTARNADAHIGLRRLRNDSTCIACTDTCDCGDYPELGL